LEALAAAEDSVQAEVAPAGVGSDRFNPCFDGLMKRGIAINGLLPNPISFNPCFGGLMKRGFSSLCIATIF
jgi:hypothetical protein